MANSPAPITTRTAATVIADDDLFGIYKAATGLWGKLTGAVLRNQLLNRTVTISNLASGGVICTAAQLDSADVIIVNQTAASKLVWLPTPNDTTKARRLTVVAGSTAPLWTAYGRFIRPHGFAVINYIPGIGYVADNVNAEQTLYILPAPSVIPLDTAENNVPLVTIPGGFMGVNSSVRVMSGIEKTSGASNVALKVKFGSFLPYNTTGMLAAASASATIDKFIANANSLTVQTAQGPLTFLGSSGASTTLLMPAGTENTASDVLVQVSAQKVTDADAVTVRSARVAFSYGG